MKYFLPLLFLFCWVNGHAQNITYTTANAHAHNDYEKAFPFWEAWNARFGSIEADIYLHDGKLIVAHDSVQLRQMRTLDSLYLKPLAQCIRANGGSVYPDAKRTMQLMIDIKSDSVATLNQLVRELGAYPSLTATPTSKIVISGNRPHPDAFSTYPAWIRFDGNLRVHYTARQLEKIEMLSGNFKHYSTWNGKGRMIEKESAAFQSLIQNVHRQGKKIRFWNAPDNLNTWYALMADGVDYLNTDRIADISAFFTNLPDRQYLNPAPHTTYSPTYRNDGASTKVKNIILLVGDGTGLAQWYAAYTANKGALNVFKMRHTGLSKTSSFDSYITDSAPGATAFSSGQKTANRAVGVDHTGKKLRLIPAIVADQKMLTGIITSGDLRDATPAAFYAHQSERSAFDAIISDLFQSPVHLLAGAMPLKGADSVKVKKSRFQFLSSIDELQPSAKGPIIVRDARAALPAASGRGEWASQAFERATALLSKNMNGFFLLLEGAQVDHGGYANKLPYLVSELLDFDKVVGKAMAFADSNGETLVIVTGDHETGGLTLTSGDHTNGMTSGQFSTDDHTAVPVPVFAYGPGAQLFSGVYENTAVFQKILNALKREQMKEL